MGLELKEVQEAVKGAVADAIKAHVEPLATQVKELGDTVTGLRNKTVEPPPAFVHGAGFKGSRIIAARKMASERDPHKGKGFGLVAIVRAQMLAKEQGGSVLDHLKHLGYDDVAQKVEANVKALGESTMAGGGALVPVEILSEVIELLYATAVMRGLSPRFVSLATGTAEIPKVTGGATASYTSENADVNATEPTTGVVVLSAKELVAIVAASNALLRDSSGAADAVIRDDIVMALGVREDLAFIRGDGTQNTPKGLRYLAASGNLITTGQGGSTPTQAEAMADLMNLIGKLQDAKVKPTPQSAAFIMSPRSARTLSQVKDTGTPYAFKDEIAQGRLLGYRLAISEQIPTNLSGSRTEIYFADMRHVFIGDAQELEVTFHPDATYVQGDQVRSGLARNQSAVRAISRHDIGLRHDAAVAVITDSKW